MTKIRWREISQQIILDVINKNPGKTETELKKILVGCYPFGPRSNHPYKIWLDEIKVQFDAKKNKDNFLTLWGISDEKER